MASYTRWCSCSPSPPWCKSCRGRYLRPPVRPASRDGLDPMGWRCVWPAPAHRNKSFGAAYGRRPSRSQFPARSHARQDNRGGAARSRGPAQEQLDGKIGASLVPRPRAGARLGDRMALCEDARLRDHSTRSCGRERGHGDQPAAPKIINPSSVMIHNHVRRAAEKANRVWLAKSVSGFLAVPVVMAGLVAGTPGTPGAAATARCVNWTGVQPPNPGAFDNRLFGVAAVSRCDAWAVGNYFDDVMENFCQTLIEHWNGSSWRHVPSPDPGGKSGNNTLLSVTAVSRTDAWAVGDYSTSGTTQALIEHWDGTAWTQVPGAQVSFANVLDGVAAVSATDVWAVGEYFNNADVGQTLIEHWDGATWTRVPSPNPGGSANGNFLSGAAAVSGAD